MDYNHQWKEELEILNSIISKTELEETTKWGTSVFTYNKKNVVSYAGFKHHFILWFYNGVFLEDKEHVLINAQEGKTKSLRQWKFTSKEEINESKILEYIYEAIEVEKKGLKIKPEKFQIIPIPKLMKDELEKDIVLNSSFEKLTPGKQKEYILYIEEAKQEKTKLSRLEKIKPMILEGKGLNDKYK